MKLGYALCTALILAGTSQAQTKPRPPGLQQAEQAETQTEQNLPPSQTARQRRIDVTQLQNDADNLARIAQTIPADISSIREGQLPKDILEKLKEIEKLSKHLRSEIKP